MSHDGIFASSQQLGVSHQEVPAILMKTQESLQNPKCSRIRQTPKATWSSF